MKIQIKKKWILWTIAAAGTAYLVFGGPFSGKKDNPTRIMTVRARMGELLYTISATGTIEPLRTYEIKSRASGTIIKMPVDTGSFVRSNGLICQLDATDEKNLLEKAKAALEVARQKLVQARANLKRQTELFKNKFVSSSTLEDYKLQLAVAKSGYISAKVERDNSLRRYNDTYVASPISGTILEKFVEPGQIISSGTSSVSGGTKIVTMADLSRVYIKAYVDETDIARVKLGLTATIVVDAYPKQKFTGSVIKVEPKAIVEQSVTSFLVTTRIDNSKGLLKPGMNASVTILVEKLKDVLLIPYTAVKQMGKNSFVFIKQKDSINVRKVRIGKSNITDVVILQGLRKGQAVITSGLTREQMQNLFKEYRSKRKSRGGNNNRRRRRSGMRRMMRQMR